MELEEKFPSQSHVPSYEEKVQTFESSWPRVIVSRFGLIYTGGKVPTVPINKEVWMWWRRIMSLPLSGVKPLLSSLKTVTILSPAYKKYRWHLNFDCFMCSLPD
jgi:hypothetical protein